MLFEPRFLGHDFWTSIITVKDTVGDPPTPHRGLNEVTAIAPISSGQLGQWRIRHGWPIDSFGLLKGLGLKKRG